MSTSVPAITLDQLVALNDEISALTRAGVPLDQGLRALGQDLPGRLGRAAAALAERLHRGESIEKAFEQMGESFPAAYRAVLMAGLRSGRLPAALEGVATNSRRVAQLRRSLIVGLVYPLAVLVVASAVLWFTSTQTQPIVFEVYAALDVEPPGWYGVLHWLSLRMGAILNIVWLLAAAIWLWWLLRSRHGASFTGGVPGLTTFGSLRWSGRMTIFTELLALLIEQSVPLDESLRLASAAGGDPRLQRDAQLLAERIQRGGAVETVPRNFPPLLAWLLTSGERQTPLVKTLRHTAAAYRRRFDRQAIWLSVYFPILLSAGIGGLVALYYVLLVMGPLYYLLYQLSLP